MAKSTTNSALPVTHEMIPGISRWVVPADKSDPRSKPLFTPWKATVEKDGTFKFTHQGVTDPIIKKRVEVIFLVEIKEVQCRCTRKGDDTNTLVCSSHDRVLSRRGDDCKTECPYAKPDEYSRPLRKTAVFLFREEGTDQPFKLARYISSLNNVQALNQLKDKFRQTLVARGETNPAPSAHVALISATTESVAKGTVGRFARDIEVGPELNADAQAAIAQLNVGILDHFNQMFSGMSAANQYAREQRIKAGSLHAQAPAAPAAAQAEQPAPKPAAAPQGPQPSYAPSEDIGGEIFGPGAEDDDDLPF